MRINHLIVVPRIVNKVGDWYQFPLGIAYISSKLKKDKYLIHNLNLNNVEGKVSDIIDEYISKYNIGIVSTGGITGQYGAIKEILECAKNKSEKIITIVGGGIISSEPIHAMIALGYADFGVIGEGEIIASELCRAIESNDDFESIPGLVIKYGKGYKITKGKPQAVDLDDLPIPDYEGFGLDKLLETVPNIIGLCEYNTLPIITSRSCPYKCTFCFHPSGQKYRQRSLDNVFSEIEYLVQKYGVKYLSIQDELFGYKMDRVAEFCNRIKKYNIKWLAQFRVTDITEELVLLLKESNCATIGFGIESAHDDVLRSMKKKITVNDINKALEIVYKAGIGIQGILIFGDTAETVETAETTLQWWKDHLHYELQLSLIITYPGTELYKYAIDNGIITDPVKYIVDGCPIVKLSKMTDAEYSWLLGQLLSLPRIMHKNPVNFKIVEADYDLGNISVNGDCAVCGMNNQWDKVRLFILETMQCNNCGSRHVSPIDDNIINKIKNNIEIIINKYGHIVLWGINSYIYALAEKLEINDNKFIDFVDKAQIRHGIEVAGHTIQNPEIINDYNIKCVVVTVVQYYSGLVGPIFEEYKGVERVLSITDLLRDDLAGDL